MITSGKAKLFFEAAIAKTKSGVLAWSRLGPDSHPRYDRQKSFIAAFAGGYLLLAVEKGDDVPRCFICPEDGCPYQMIAGFDGDVLRLYNVVYSKFPSVESFMDAMIHLDSDPNQLPF